MSLDETDDEVVETGNPENSAEETDEVTEENAEEEQDVDDITLAEAEKELEAEANSDEESEGSEGGPDENAEATDAAAAADAKEGNEGEAAEGAAADDAGTTPTIPKARFDQVLKERDEAIQTAAYFRGVADERRAAGTGDGDDTAAKTPEEQVAELRAEKAGFAAKFDEGGMTLVEYEAEKDRIEDAVRAVQQEASKPAQAPAATQPEQTTDSLYLEERTQQIEADHPYSTLIESDEDWGYLARKTVESLVSEGVVLPQGQLDQRNQLLLRERIAALTDTYGPTMTGIPVDKLPKTGESTTEGKEPDKPSEAAEARRNKLAQAAGHPPDIAELGEAGSVDKDPTDAEIEQMSDEEIMALPAETRRRIEARGA